MTVSVRPAVPSDVPAMVALITEERKDLAVRQPVFWRPAKEAPAATKEYFQYLLRLQTTFGFVAQEADILVGFVIGYDMSPPPVYDPGGATVMIDDWVVPSRKDRGCVLEALYLAVERAARNAGARQVVCVAATHDEDKQEFLKAHNHAATATWWTKPF